MVGKLEEYSLKSEWMQPDYIDCIRCIASLATKKKIRSIDKPLAFYGAGNLGRLAKRFCDNLGIPIAFAVDANPENARKDPFWNGVKIYGSCEVPDNLKSEVLLAVCIVTVPYSDIHSKLVENGWSDIVTFYDIAQGYHDKYPLNNGWSIGEVSTELLTEMEKTIDSWSDDISKKYYLQFIAWRALRYEMIFPDAAVMPENRFFIPEIMNALIEDEVFLDIGAHHCEVTKNYIVKSGNKFSKIYSIEPDSFNFSQMKNELNGLTPDIREKIHLMNIALNSSAGDYCFCEGLDYCSQIFNTGKRKISAKTLDSLNISPSFIKIHIEGWELEVLKGGIQTLIENRPVLAVTVYHNDDGIYKTASFLRDNLKNYHFYFRLHGWQGTGAVLYAIPNERVR